jgi:hypothetical protein
MVKIEDPHLLLADTVMSIRGFCRKVKTISSIAFGKSFNFFPQDDGNNHFH